MKLTDDGGIDPRTSRPALDRCGCFAHLVLIRGLGNAVTHVIVQQRDGNPLERVAGRDDLRQDVHAVLITLDHPLQAAYLALDTPKPSEYVVFVLVIPGGAARLGGRGPLEQGLEPGDLGNGSDPLEVACRGIPCLEQARGDV